MSRSKTSKRWLLEHFNDEYVKRAKAEGYRSRAVYKLIEVQDKDHFIKPGMTVVDLGAAPGGWSQIATKIVGGKGEVFALDILPMDPLAGVDIIQGDFREESVLNELTERLQGKSIDLVISDMAPNMSGNKVVDQPRSMYLAELALDFAINMLKPGGDYLTKLFHGEGFEEYLKTTRQHFKKIIIRKPKASRARSHEVYMLAKTKK